MDTTQIQEPLTQFIHKIPKTIEIDQVIIFGSYLEGTATKDSDIDVIVVSDDFKNMSEDDRLTLLYRASRFIEPDIHPWGFTPEELQQASHLTPIGYVRDKGFRFPVSV